MNAGNSDLRSWPQVTRWVAAFLVLGLAGLGAFISSRWQRVHALTTHIDRLVAERRALRQANPELTTAQAAGIAQEIARVDTRLASAVAPWRARGGSGDTDPFLRLADFVSAGRQRLQLHGVKLTPEERLGFADCLEHPPPEGEWARLHHELALIEVGLAALADSGARELRSLQRGGASPASERTDPARRGGARRDVLALARAEITFVGDTAALRRFVNALLEAQPRVWIESFEADAGSAGAAPDRGVVFRIRISRPCWGPAPEEGST